MSTAELHDCSTCQDCIHGENRCCGCYDGACCKGIKWDVGSGLPS